MVGQRRRRNEGGFTLIELLVVIIILGVLAAIVVFAVGGVTDKGKAASCKTDVKSVEVAEEAYYSKNSTYTPIPNLVTQNLLREKPSTNNYTVTVNLITGDVSSSPVCSGL